MDELQQSIYVDRARLSFHTLQGAAFQDWFVRLAGFAFGDDFEEVRPYGPWAISNATAAVSALDPCFSATHPI